LLSSRSVTDQAGGLVVRAPNHLGELILALPALGYAAAAGLVLLVAGERGRVVLADTFVMSALLICAIEFIAFLIHYYVTPLPLDFFGYQFKAGGQLEGYAQNPNAFAFQLLMAMCVLIAFHPLRARRPEMAWSWLGVAAIAAIIVVVRTRAGILAGLVIGALAILLPRIPSRLAIGRKQLALDLRPWLGEKRC